MYGVNYNDVYIVDVGDSTDMLEDAFETWAEAQFALISYYENQIQDARTAIREAKQLKK